MNPVAEGVRRKVVTTGLDPSAAFAAWQAKATRLFWKAL